MKYYILCFDKFLFATKLLFLQVQHSNLDTLGATNLSHLPEPQPISIPQSYPAESPKEINEIFIKPF